MNFNDLAALLLLFATFIITAIAVIAGLLAFFGFRIIKSEAIKETEKVIKKSIESGNAQKIIIAETRRIFLPFKDGALPDELIDAIPKEVFDKNL